MGKRMSDSIEHSSFIHVFFSKQNLSSPVAFPFTGSIDHSAAEVAVTEGLAEFILHFLFCRA